MRYVGIGISKNRLDTCIVDGTGKIVAREALPNNREGFDELAKLVDPSWPIGIEAGTLAYPVHDHLTVRGYDIRMGDAKRMKIIWECDQKFDGKDAFEIADLVRVNKFPMSTCRTRTCSRPASWSELARTWSSRRPRPSSAWARTCAGRVSGHRSGQRRCTAARV